MNAELLQVLPNLSIGVVSIGALVYITVRFLQQLEQRSTAHESAMQEREIALRNVEKEIRVELSTALSNSTQAVVENGRVMERVIRVLDQKV